MNYNNEYPKRKAILIGCPGNTKNFLSGVEHDLVNLSKYLQSENGGAWYESEIKALYNPSYYQVKQEVENAVADYTIVYFSGHGYTDSDKNRRMLSLKDLDISDKHLLNNSPRQLILIDACRNFIGQGLTGLPDYESDLSYFEGSPARRLFNNYIKNSPAGKLIIHGTQRGKFSYDSSTGGMFTNALINIGTRIKADTKYTQAQINQILTHIPEELHRRNNYQVPSIEYKSGNLTVPFAIGVPKFIDQTISQQRQLITDDNNSSNGGWLALGFFGLLVLGVGIAASSSK